jgi:thymidylate synthase ThyX
MATLNASYQDLMEMGVKTEDARGILPTNICTNILVKYNLRTLSDLVASRASPRTQGEFRLVMEAMYNEVLRVHPWAEFFLNDHKAQAAKELDKFVAENNGGLEMIKNIDMLRK